MTSAKRGIALAAGVVVVVVAAAAAMLLQSQTRQSAASFAAPPAVTPRPAAPISRELAIQRAQEDRSELRRTDRIDAKMTTPLEFARAKNSPDAGSETDNTTRVWAVAVGGEIVPSFAKAGDFNWAVLLFNADTGSSLGMAAGKSPSAWPPFWDTLPDRSR